MKEQIKVDCPYCQAPMRVSLSNSTTGCHNLIEPYNSPESWHYEVYYCSCNNNHAGITLCIYEYYYRQYSDWDEYNKAHDAYNGPLTRHGYKPIAYNRVFDGTIRLSALYISLVSDKKIYASFNAYAGENGWSDVPVVIIHNDENPYDEEIIKCPFEWLALSPDQIIDEMKKIIWWIGI